VRRSRLLGAVVPAVGAVVVALTAGCGQVARAEVNPLTYTCAQLRADFAAGADAPADRLEAVVAALAARTGDAARSNGAAREEIVYALTAACGRVRRADYRPGLAALRFVRSVYAGH
jgi:hypothetical protein